MRSCQAPGTREVLRKSPDTICPEIIGRGHWLIIMSPATAGLPPAAEALLAVPGSGDLERPAQLRRRPSSAMNNAHRAIAPPFPGKGFDGAVCSCRSLAHSASCGARAESPPAHPGGRTGRAPSACPALAVRWAPYGAFPRMTVSADPHTPIDIALSGGGSVQRPSGMLSGFCCSMSPPALAPAHRARGCHPERRFNR